MTDAYSPICETCKELFQFEPVYSKLHRHIKQLKPLHSLRHSKYTSAHKHHGTIRALRAGCSHCRLCRYIFNTMYSQEYTSAWSAAQKEAFYSRHYECDVVLNVDFSLHSLVVAPLVEDKPGVRMTTRVKIPIQPRDERWAPASDKNYNSEHALSSWFAKHSHIRSASPAAARARDLLRPFSMSRGNSRVRDQSRARSRGPASSRAASKIRMPNPSNTDGDAEFRSTGSSRIMQKIREWDQICEKSHAECTTSSRTQFLPKRLLYCGGNAEIVSVRQGTEIPRDCRYAALSYRRGAVGLDYCLTPESQRMLRLGVHTADLPRSFRDAIKVTRALGLDHLWIDALCLLQGDCDESRREWQTEAPKIGQTFASCTINISATDAEDSHSGLFYRRDGNDVRPCPVQQEFIPAPSKHRHHNSHVERHDFELHFGSPLQDIEHAGVNNCGWAMQERLLAPRVLYFCKSRVYWECSSCVMDDLNDAPVYKSRGDPEWKSESTRRTVDDVLHAASPAKPEEAMRAWSRLVAAYSSCHFSRPEDRLLAIAGLGQKFARPLKDNIAAGLWLNDLPRQLLWRVAEDAPLPPVHSSRNPLRFAPSWSWAAAGTAVTPATVHAPYACFDPLIRDYGAAACPLQSQHEHGYEQADLLDQQKVLNLRAHPIAFALPRGAFADGSASFEEPSPAATLERCVGGTFALRSRGLSLRGSSQQQVRNAKLFRNCLAFSARRDRGAACGERPGPAGGLHLLPVALRSDASTGPAEAAVIFAEGLLVEEVGAGSDPACARRFRRVGHWDALFYSNFRADYWGNLLLQDVVLV